MPTGIYKRKLGQGYKKGHKGFWLGKKRPPISEKHKKIISKSNMGKNSYAWKGEKVSYSGIHHWIKRKLGSPKYCAVCQNTRLNNRQYNWANISHSYRRKLSDWIRLCVRCHKKYDSGKIKL